MLVGLQGADIGMRRSRWVDRKLILAWVKAVGLTRNWHWYGEEPWDWQETDIGVVNQRNWHWYGEEQKKLTLVWWGALEADIGMMRSKRSWYFYGEEPKKVTLVWRRAQKADIYVVRSKRSWHCYGDEQKKLIFLWRGAQEGDTDMKKSTRSWHWYGEEPKKLTLVWWEAVGLTRSWHWYGEEPYGWQKANIGLVRAVDKKLTLVQWRAVGLTRSWQGNELLGKEWGLCIEMVLELLRITYQEPWWELFKKVMSPCKRKWHTWNLQDYIYLIIFCCRKGHNVETNTERAKFLCTIPKSFKNVPESIGHYWKSLTVPKMLYLCSHFSHLFGF